MYNLLMAGVPGYWDERDTDDTEWQRFLEHTQDAIRTKFLPATDESIRELMGFPTLFAYEFHLQPARRAREEPAFAKVGRLLEVRRRQAEIQFRYEFTSEIDPIPMESIVELAWELDINVKGNENYRSHWAIKDVDLMAVFKRHGLITETFPVAPDIAAQLRDLAAQTPNAAQSSPKVFIVHGRDDGIKNEVARWVSKIGMEEVILHEQPNIGRAMITKFQDESAHADFAIVIMTPDDVGGLAGDAQSKRARQNVIFELGYFIGKLGSRRVAALIVGPDIEKPSDYDGVAYIGYDQRGAWKLDLAREFIALGIPFDLARSF